MATIFTRRASTAVDPFGRRLSSAQLLDTQGTRRVSNAFASTGVRSNFPPVILDKTLYDFLSEELRDGETVETHCALKPHSDPAFGDSVPMNRKYLIHSAQVGNPDDLAHMGLEVCAFLLNFFVGPMKVVIIASEGNTTDKSLHQQAIYRNAVNNFSVLQPNQRPEFMCYRNKDDFWVNHDGSKIRFAFAMDIAEPVSTVFEPDLTYLLNTKRWLAKTIRETGGDMAAPNDVLIDTEIRCKSHATRDGFWYNGGRGCPVCTRGIVEEVDRVRQILEERQLPFVLKMTQSVASVGTYLVTTEDLREEVIGKIRRILLDYLPRITKQNAHLYPLTLVMSDLIPGRTMALNFFVRRDGSCLFSGACNQLATGKTGRQTTAISYPDQEMLEAKYRTTLAKTCKLLNKAGYYGQAGIDVMENESTGTQYVIDANVRTALSLLL